MKQSSIHDISTKTQTGSAPADGAATRQLRQGRAFGAGLLPNAGVLALLLSLPLGASLLTAGEKPHQPQYRFTEIPVPGPSFAVGINDEGLVTGYYGDPTMGDVFSFLYERGGLTTGIAAPGATITSVGGANNRGVDTGNYGNEANQQAAFYDIRRGTFTPLPEIPGMPLNFGNGINDFGHVSGVAYASGDWSLGGTGLGQNWIWDGENYSFYTVPGAVNGAQAGGINNRDQVTGLYVGSSGLPQGFIKDGDKYTTLDVPGAIYTLASGINNQGTVVGSYLDASGNHGFIWSNGEFVTVDVTISGAVGTGWYSSNEHGDLAGVYGDASGVFHAVIALRADGDGDGDGDGHDRH
jgi:probable HAF family extracellular repeat protein